MRSTDRFETGSLPGWRLARIALAGLAILAAALGWSWALDGAGSRQLTAPPPPRQASALTGGLIDSDREQHALAARRETLGRYAWVDRAHGVVAIPIDQAMTVLVRRSP